MVALILAAIWVAVAGLSLFWGLDYYVLSPEARAFSPLADLFAPTGIVGQGFGIVGTIMIGVGVAMYGARKRVAFLARFGSLRTWLQMHIFLCTLGPFLVLLHTTFKFGGIVSIAFWSMAVVVVSGVFGRYVYVRIPKTLNGAFLSLEAVRKRADELGERIRQVAGLENADLAMVLGKPPVSTPRSLSGALVFAFREDVRSRARVRIARQFLEERGVPVSARKEVLSLARENAKVVRQAAVLRPFQRLFGYWHVMHLPLALLMFAILAIHVGVAILFGYTWIF